MAISSLFMLEFDKAAAAYPTRPSVGVPKQTLLGITAPISGHGGLSLNPATDAPTYDT